MVEIGNNFGKNKNCVICQIKEDMNHIYSCEYLNKQEIKIEFSKIYEGNLFEKIKVFRRFNDNMKKRNEEKSKVTKSPCDPFCDPLNCEMFSIG